MKVVIGEKNFVAVSREIPRKHSSCECSIIEVINGEYHLVTKKIEEIETVLPLATGIYLVVASNQNFVVQTMEE